MTAHARHPFRERGNVLLAVIIVVLALAGLSLAFLETGVQETKTNTVAGEKSRVGYIAESGVNQAVGDLLTGGSGSIGSPTEPVAFGAGTFWVRAEDNGDGTHTVLSVGRVNDQVEALEVILAPEDVPLFSRALFGDLDLGAKGSVFTDSYDSDLGSYASQATNTHSTSGEPYALPNGHLGSNRNIILRGGVRILGNATPGPGYTVQVNGTEVIVEGSTAPASSPTILPPVRFEPAGTATEAFSTNGEHLFTSGTYHFTSFQGLANAKIRFQGEVILYVDGSFDVGGLAGMIVEKDSTVVVYHAGDSFSITGGGLINETEKPANFRVHSRASTVKFTGNSSFYGVVYAPHGQLDPGGTADIFGSFVARQIDVDGTARFHYDEALSREAPDQFRRLKRVSWRRISIAEAMVPATH
jgi:hypothetical protein